MKDLISLLPRIDAAIAREARSAVARGRKQQGLRRQFTLEQEAILRDTRISSRRAASMLSTGFRQVDLWRTANGIPNPRKECAQ